MERGKVTRQALAEFFEAHDIRHAERVVFDVDGYTVHSFRRDGDDKYVLSQDHPGEPIREVEHFLYGN